MQSRRAALKVRRSGSVESANFSPPGEANPPELEADFLQETFQELLTELVGARNYHHWFHEKTTLSVADDQLIIGVGSPFLLKWMNKHFREATAQVAQVILGPSAHARFEVDGSISFAPAARTESEPAPGTATSVKGKAAPASPTARTQQGAKSAQPAEPTQSPTAPVRTGRRFANLGEFIQGRCNELALTAARQVCTAPGQLFNPLYLHGGVGTGKTHLLEGIYKDIRERFPSLQVMFLTAEAFANYFTQALRDHTLPSFRQKFRSVDVLLVDDIDFLNGKRGIQGEFLHTFQQLESHGRQVVISADSHPRLLSKLSEELITRFLSGLVCRLESPDALTRKAIVQAKALKMQANVSEAALDYVAQRFQNNVRELEGALNCLVTHQRMTGRKVSQTAARSVLSDLEKDCVQVVRMSDIENTVCKFFGVDADDLKSAKRHRYLSQPRMLAMFLARKLTQAAYSEIGRYFGNRNHGTVHAAEKKVRSWLEENTEIKVAAQSWQVSDLMETLEHQLRYGA